MTTNTKKNEKGKNLQQIDTRKKIFIYYLFILACRINISVILNFIMLPKLNALCQLFFKNKSYTEMAFRRLFVTHSQETPNLEDQSVLI